MMFKPGDIVKFNQRFLGVVGPHFHSPTYGKVIELKDDFAEVEWSDGSTSLAHQNNLELLK